MNVNGYTHIHKSIITFIKITKRGFKIMEKKQDYFRVPITMPSNMVSFLENLGIECKKSGGHKVANTEIVRALIKLLMDLDVDLSGIKSEEELESRLKDAARRYK